MPGLNLTRDEARERAGLLRVAAYEIDLDLTRGETVFGSTTVIRFDATRPGASTFVDLVARTVHEITLNGRALDPATAFVDHRIALDDLAATNEVRIVADCVYMNTGEGLHRMVDPADGGVYLYSNFEVPDARRMFATFEQPDLKGTFAFTVTAPSGWVVLSCEPTPAPEPVREGVSVWRFAPTPPISTYITALVAGDYHVVEEVYTSANGQVIPMAVACRQSMARFLDADNIFEVTRQGFDYFLDVFDRPYPFTKYDQVFVPEYNMGAMENVGCVTIVEDYLFRAKVTDARYQDRAETILHEMAHMWFGDLVTMFWWDDLWLKESFATYVSQRCLAEATRWTEAWTTAANSDKAWAFTQDLLPSTHPIVADIRDLEDVAGNFDGITYAKGAAVLKQLVAWVGSDHFFAGVKYYFDKHAWGNTTLSDLLEALERTSGRDLRTWSREWLETAGPSTLTPAYTVGADGTYDSFTIGQTVPAEHPTLRSHRIAVGLYDRVDGELVRADRIELDVTGARTEVPQLVGKPARDLVLVNEDDLTYARIRFDPRSLAAVLDGVGEFTASLPRALCWTAAWDMVRSAELAPRAYVQMVLAGIGRETDIGVVGTLHQTLLTTLDRFVDPAHRAETAARVADAAQRHAYAAEPGSDVQLVWVRLLARVAERDADLAVLAGLLDGTTAIEGLAIDAELRWALLAGLVKHGRAGESEIDAELAADQTTAGTQYAAGARAALPAAGAKAEAWAAALDGDLSNGARTQVIGASSRIGLGFAQPAQTALLRDYAEEYFAVVADVWAQKSSEIARSFAAGMYPKLFIEQATVDRTDEFLATADPVPALRRVILEGRDDVVRALAARAADRI